MSDCTHDCSTCGGSCHFELPEGETPRDVMNDLNEFIENMDVDAFNALIEELVNSDN